MTRRLLVVATAPDPSDELLERLGEHAGGDVEVTVVAPASDVSFLEWVADDESRARREAEQRAKEAAEVEALATRVVDVEVGDPNPLRAIDDVLRRFPADELVVVTRPKESARWLERAVLSGELDRLGLPVTHLVDDDANRPAAGEPGPAGQGDRGVVGFVLGNLVLTLALAAGLVVAAAFSLYFGLR
jgi:hypothetical protein